MLVTNLRKTIKEVSGKRLRPSLIVGFADKLAYEITEKGKDNYTDSQEISTVVTATTYDNTKSSTLSSSPLRILSHHKNRKLGKGRQLWCISCSRVHLVEQKITLACNDCGKVFCNDSTGRGCWSFYVATGGVSAPLKKGSRKRKVSECWTDMVSGLTTGD